MNKRFQKHFNTVQNAFHRVGKILRKETFEACILALSDVEEFIQYTFDRGFMEEFDSEKEQQEYLLLFKQTDFIIRKVIDLLVYENADEIGTRSDDCSKAYYAVRFALEHRNKINSTYSDFEKNFEHGNVKGLKAILSASRAERKIHRRVQYKPLQDVLDEMNEQTQNVLEFTPPNRDYDFVTVLYKSGSYVRRESLKVPRNSDHDAISGLMFDALFEDKKLVQY